MKYSFDVFVSYAHQDHGFAVQVVSWLRRCGFRVWLDEEQLVPGSRFRAGLQQGLRESQHMLSVLTAAYCTRPWTQRELDLFDLSADHSDRRLLALQLDKLDVDPLDQVILVHQRVLWNGRSFDPVAFWKLYCGLTGRIPGPRDEWRRNGEDLVQASARTRVADPCDSSDSFETDQNRVVGSDPPPGDVSHLVNLSLEASNWNQAFATLRNQLSTNEQKKPIIQDLLPNAWAVGHADHAAVLALALLPQIHIRVSAWPFLDLSCDHIVQWFLIGATIQQFERSEIWFSWAVSQQSWSLLSAAATLAPHESLSEHFQALADSASGCANFSEAEERYDYGVMITPWNHFHLCWLAMRFSDWDAASAHARKLCSTTSVFGDLRTGRFLNRLTTWDVFAPLRAESEVRQDIATARQSLGLPDSDKIPSIQKRLSEIWRFARSSSQHSGG